MAQKLKTQDDTANFVSLFASSSTLICCALPAIFVALGAGASFASLVSTFPFLIVLSQYKIYISFTALTMLAIAGIINYRTYFMPCPADPELGRLCLQTRQRSRMLYYLSSAIFISAMDTTPLCADPAVVIAEQSEAFENGLAVLDRLAEGKVFVGKAPGASIPTGKATVTEFGGVHPAGNVGTHIHFLHPVAVSRVVWTLGYQDVIAIAH